MNGGAKFCALAASLAASGCQSGPGAVEVRALANPADRIRSGSDGLADARAQLALGNAGLALEGFRKVLRYSPDNPEAYAGIAKCYEAMGRYDLARKNYEAALAFAPGIPACSRDLRSRLPPPRLRRSPWSCPRPSPPRRLKSAPIMHRDLPPPTVNLAGAGDSLAKVTRLDALAVAGPSITVELPPARPAQSAVAAATPDRGRVIVATAEQPAAIAVRRYRDLPAPVVDVRAAAASALAVREADLASAGPSITVELPPARPASPAAESRALAALKGPRLERLSPGEVALVTTGRPLWRGQLLAQARTTAEVRWVPLMKMASRPNIRLLNAGQRQELAAQSRAMLLDRGWRKIEIGNALDVRDESMVMLSGLAPDIGPQPGRAVRIVQAGPRQGRRPHRASRPQLGAPRCLHEARMIASLLVALSVASAQPVSRRRRLGKPARRLPPDASTRQGS